MLAIVNYPYFEVEASTFEPHKEGQVWNRLKPHFSTKMTCYDEREVREACEFIEEFAMKLKGTGMTVCYDVRRYDAPPPITYVRERKYIKS